MAIQVARDYRVYADEFDLSGVLRSVALTIGRETVDVTTLLHTTRANLASLGTWGVGISGLMDPVAAYDGAINTQLSRASAVATIATNNTAGSVAFFAQGMAVNYSFGGAVGDAFTFDASLAGSSAGGPLVRGVVEQAAGTVSASGNTSGRLIGAVSSTQRVYCAFHALSKSGTSPTLAVKVQSDDNSGFTTPTDRITLTTFSDVGAQFSSAAGAITDTYWRFNYVLGGSSTPTYGVIGIIGII